MPHPLSCLLTVALFAQGVAPCALAATEPIWWSAPATKIWEHQPVNVDNYAPLAVGQLKHVAAMAKKHLDSALSAQGGAGPEINNMINTFGGPTLGNLASANVGQLKAVAAPFYKRFAQSGVNFDAVDQLLQRQLLTSSSMTSIESGVRYPWTNIPTEHRAVATIGQLKVVFGFDLADRDNDGLDDAWEIHYYGNTNAVNDPHADDDGDGLSNLEEMWLGTNPNLADTDGDGYSDLFEQQNGTAPNNNNDKPRDDDDFDGDGLENYWEIVLDLDPANPKSGDGVHLDGELDHDGDQIPNANDAHPNQVLIAWPRVPESRYLVVPLTNGLSNFQNVEVWDMNDSGKVVGLEDESTSGFPSSYRQVVVWNGSTWGALTSTLDMPNTGRYRTTPNGPVHHHDCRFFTTDSNFNSESYRPVLIGPDGTVVAHAYLQVNESGTWQSIPISGDYETRSLVWLGTNGLPASIPVPLGRNPEWDSNQQMIGTAYDFISPHAVIGAGGSVICDFMPGSQSTRVLSPPYEGLGDAAVSTDISPTSGWMVTPAIPPDVPAGNYVSGFGYVSNPSTSIRYDSNPLGGELFPITRMPSKTGIPLAGPHAVLSGKGRLYIETNWNAPISLLSAPDTHLNRFATLNTRGELLLPASRPLPDTDVPKLWRNGRIRMIQDLLANPGAWTITSAVDLNNHGVILATAKPNGGSNSQPVILLPMEVNCPELYMFGGHKNDVVELCKVSGIPCEWKLKNTTPVIGTFNHPTDTACSFTATTAGKNTIQLVIGGNVVWEKPTEVLQIISRATWGAYAADTAKLSTTPTLNGITFHHSSNTADGAAEVLRIQDMHMQKSVIYWPRPGDGWGDIGYHFLMDKAGNVYQGRQLEAAPGVIDGPYTLGSHVESNNTAAGIGICILGDYEGAEAFPSARQEALEKALSAIARRHKLTADKVSYHKARATTNPTECPGSNVIPKAADIIKNVGRNLQ